MSSVAVGLESEYLHAKVVITDVHPYTGDNMSLAGRDEIDMLYLDGPHQGEHATTYRIA